MMVITLSALFTAFFLKKKNVMPLCLFARMSSRVQFEVENFPFLTSGIIFFHRMVLATGKSIYWLATFSQNRFFTILHMD